MKLTLAAIVCGLVLQSATSIVAAEKAPAESPPAGARRPATAPQWTDVDRSVQEFFHARDGFQPRDLITRVQVEAVLGRLETLGWTVPESKALLAQVLGDDEFLVRQLGSKSGQKFMRHVAQYPLGYDRLERMSRLPRGQIFVRDLIANPGGYKMIEYMATASGGIEMGKMLSETPDGKQFNAPTGHIYMVDQLLAALRTRFDQGKKGPQG